MSNVKTRIDPNLHVIECGDCDRILEFQKIESLSKDICAEGFLYYDSDLRRGSCQACGSKRLSIALKSNRPKKEGESNAAHARTAQQASPFLETIIPAGDSLQEAQIEQYQVTEIPAAQANWQNGLLDQFYREVFAIEQQDHLSPEQKVSRIRHTACVACAATAIQPIPFADIFILTPMQGYFASRIAAIRGVKVSENDGQEWTKQIIGLMGLGFIAQQIAIGVWKLATWGVGGLLTIPLVYSLTYAVMTTADVYFKQRANGIELSDDELREILKKASKKGKKEAQLNETAVRKMAEQQVHQ